MIVGFAPLGFCLAPTISFSIFICFFICFGGFTICLQACMYFTIISIIISGKNTINILWANRWEILLLSYLLNSVQRSIMPREGPSIKILANTGYLEFELYFSKNAKVEKKGICFWEGKGLWTCMQLQSQ